MSLYDYRYSIELSADDPPFHALIMAAMRKADTDNLERLKAAWPDVWDELCRRYKANFGRLPEDDDFEVKVLMWRDQYASEELDIRDPPS